MPHVRSQIRQAVKTLLQDELGAGYRVYASRKSATNHVPETALIDMRFLNDQTRQEETMNYIDAEHGARIHIASLYIRVHRSANEEKLDDLLDQDEVAVIAAMEAGDWDDLLEEEPELIQVNFIDDGSAGHIIGAIVLRFDLEYRINRNNPEQSIS